jgi:hypothetical protein
MSRDVLFLAPSPFAPLCRYVFLGSVFRDIKRVDFASVQSAMGVIVLIAGFLAVRCSRAALKGLGPL